MQAGDFTRFGRLSDAIDFNEWLGTLPYQHRIVVLGNHEANADYASAPQKVLTNATVLCHSGVTLECGLSIFGCDFYWPATDAWTPPYAAIPADVDVLVAHGPCAGHVDGGVGCPALLQHVARVRPRLVVAGHIHEARGVVEGDGELAGVVFVNAANARGREGDRKARARGPHPPFVAGLRPRARGAHDQPLTNGMAPDPVRVVELERAAQQVVAVV